MQYHNDHIVSFAHISLHGIPVQSSILMRPIYGVGIVGGHGSASTAGYNSTAPDSWQESAVLWWWTRWRLSEARQTVLMRHFVQFWCLFSQCSCAKLNNRMARFHCGFGYKRKPTLQTVILNNFCTAYMYLKCIHFGLEMYYFFIKFGCFRMKNVIFFNLVIVSIFLQ